MLNRSKQLSCDTINIFEIGTGSGNIAVSLAKFDPRIRCVAIDISESAITVAQENAVIHGVEQQIKFLQQDFLNFNDSVGSDYDFIISNPPYVSAEEYDDLQEEIRDYEPRGAVTDEADGFRFFEHILQIAPLHLRDKGECLVEIAYNQGAEVLKRFSNVFSQVELKKDLGGHERLVIGSGKKDAGINTKS